MKNNYWVILGAMLSTSLLAQQATNPAPAAPISTPAAAPAATIAAPVTKTNAPAAPTAKKKASKKKTTEKQAPKAPQKKAVTKKKEPVAELKTVPLIAGPAIVVASNVNVRGQAKLKSEVVTKITKGDPISELLESRNYDLKEIGGCYELQFNRAVDEGRITADEAKSNLGRLQKFMASFPYLEQ